jgi:hypothetical protein
MSSWKYQDQAKRRCQVVRVNCTEKRDDCKALKNQHKAPFYVHDFLSQFCIITYPEEGQSNDSFMFGVWGSIGLDLR